MGKEYLILENNSKLRWSGTHWYLETKNGEHSISTEIEVSHISILPLLELDNENLYKRLEFICRDSTRIDEVVSFAVQVAFKHSSEYWVKLALEKMKGCSLDTRKFRVQLSKIAQNKDFSQGTRHLAGKIASSN